MVTMVTMLTVVTMVIFLLLWSMVLLNFTLDFRVTTAINVQALYLLTSIITIYLLLGTSD